MAGAEDDTGFGGLRKMLSGPAVDVPCRMLCSGLQVARVIGKAGVLIKELREESGCIVNILDTQLPVAFTNRDERILLLRGTLEQIAIAVSGILRLSLGMNAGIKGDSEEHKRTVEIMIPEPSCSHLIGEKGARIGALMDETHCDLHIVREPVSGLLDQKRLRITGPTLKDMETAIMKVQECLVDLTKFGSLQDKHFDIREGPTAEADLVPRAKGPGSSVTVAMLLPKDEVGWVLGKRGSKISKLRERARVAVNDAETPPFPSQQVTIEINGAPLSELIYVLQLLLDDLMLRQGAGTTTRLLLPHDRFGAVIGEGGEVIRRIAQESGASLSQLPAERQGNNFYPMRAIDVTGSERERIAAATALYQAIENASPGGAPQASTATSKFGQAAIARAQEVPRAKDPPAQLHGSIPDRVAGTQPDRQIAGDPRPSENRNTSSQSGIDQGAYRIMPVPAATLRAKDPPVPELHGSIPDRITDTQPDRPTAEESRSENLFASPRSGLDQGGHRKSPGPAAPPQSIVTAPNNALVAPSGDALAPASISFQRKDSASVKPIVGDRLVACGGHLPPAQTGVAPHGAPSNSAASASAAGGAIPNIDGHGPSHTVTSFNTSSDTTTMFVVLPGMDVVKMLMGSDLGIGRRSGSELMAGHGANGEALLRISGKPMSNAVACYFVQEAMWMGNLYSRSLGAQPVPPFGYPMRA